MTDSQQQPYSTEMELDVPDGIPEGLFVSVYTYIDDQSWMPPQGTPGLRAMVKVGGQARQGDFEWVAAQEKLQAEAAQVLAAIHDVEPMPTKEELMNDESAEYPEWVGEAWMQTLMLPWSQDLSEAIKEGLAYVESATKSA